MSTQRLIIGTNSTNVDLSQSNVITLNAPTTVNISSAINSPAYQKSSTQADVARVGNSFATTGNMSCGLNSMPTVSGTNSTVYGTSCLTNLTGGTGSHTLIGHSIMSNAAANTSLSCNAIGNNALANLQSGQSNICIGNFACSGLTAASNNVQIGNFTSFGRTTGDNNTSVGASSGPTTNISATIALGRQSTPNTANSFVFGSSVAPINFLAPEQTQTTNTCDIGTATTKFKSLYLATDIKGAGTQTLTMTGNDFVMSASLFTSTAFPRCTRTPFGCLLSTGATTVYANAYTVGAPTRLITMTSNAGSATPQLFTIGATGVMTYTGTIAAYVRIDFTYSYTNTTNSSAVITHWVSINGSLTAPTNSTSVESRTFVNALNNIYLPASISTIIQLQPNDTIQLVGNIAPAANLTVNYRSIGYTVSHVLANT